MILGIIWRNIWRNKRRTLITMASVAFTVILAVSMKSLQNGVFANLIKNMVSYYSGYLQVHKNGYWAEKVLDNCFDSKDSTLLANLKDPMINQLIPRIENFVLFSNGNQTKGALLVGIDPKLEEPLTHFSSKIIEGNFWNEYDTHAIVMGSGLASKLNLKLNDTVFILGQGYRESFVAGAFPIKGLIKFGSPELNNSISFIPISNANELLNMENRITAFVLDIKDSENMNTIQKNLQAKLSKEYEIQTWKEMLPEIDNHIRADGNGFYIMMAILYIIILFGIFGTLFMITT